MIFASRMGQHHHHCDELFASAEQAVESGEWDKAATAHQRFIDAMERHLQAEEQMLFPSFEEVSGMTMGPTEVMRHEHEQMRQLFSEMTAALENQSSEDYLGASETLLIFMQQHNAKEEQILYPMLDQMLAPQSDALASELEKRLAEAR